jgi:hypothetical protein
MRHQQLLSLVSGSDDAQTQQQAAALAWGFLLRPIVVGDFHEELQYAVSPARYCLPGG